MGNKARWGTIVVDGSEYYLVPKREAIELERCALVITSGLGVRAPSKRPFFRKGSVAERLIMFLSDENRVVTLERAKAFVAELKLGVGETAVSSALRDLRLKGYVEDMGDHRYRATPKAVEEFAKRAGTKR